MRFLLRVAFWLALVYVLLPGEKPERAKSDRVMSDRISTQAPPARDFCTRHADACAAGAKAWKTVEQRTQSGVKTIQDLLAEPAKPGQGAHPDKSGPAASPNTLTSADQALPAKRPR